MKKILLVLLTLCLLCSLIACDKGDDPETNDTRIIGKPCYGSGHFILIKAFYNALRTGAPTPVSLESAQWAIRILLAAYKSNDEEVEI